MAMECPTIIALDSATVDAADETAENFQNLNLDDEYDPENPAIRNDVFLNGDGQAAPQI